MERPVPLAIKRSLSGILCVDKPQGMTSAAVVRQVKKALGVEKLGHCGTLDPLATGLLVLLTNRATRLASWVEEGAKRYSGEILFGRSTTTDDIEGEVLTESAHLPEEDAVLAAAQSFIGEISQVPPQYSAIKVEGARAYALARRGEAVQLEPRKVRVDSFVLRRRGAGRFSFTVECSKGTYIRSLARDLGAALGSGACLSSLRREASFPFDISQAVPLTVVSWEHVVDWAVLFPSAPTCVLDEKERQAFSIGDERLLKALSGRLPLAPLVVARDRKAESLGLIARQGTRFRYAANVPYRLGE